MDPIAQNQVFETFVCNYICISNAYKATSQLQKQLTVYDSLGLIRPFNVLCLNAACLSRMQLKAKNSK